MSVTKYKVSELVFDQDLYPRPDVDPQNVGKLAEAMKVGRELPPVVVEKKTRRIVDGVHRMRAYLRVYGPDHVIECVEKSYKTEADLFADAMRFNAGHGLSLTSYDRAYCLTIAERLGVSDEIVASAMNMTVEALGTLRVDRVGTTLITATRKAEPVILKRTIRHMAGRELSPVQEQANKRLSGMQPRFYINQILALLEADLINPSDEEIDALLRRLADVIEARLAAVGAKQ